VMAPPMGAHQAARAANRVCVGLGEMVEGGPYGAVRMASWRSNMSPGVALTSATFGYPVTIRSAISIAVQGTADRAHVCAV
jgi:hypothetical protein